MLPVSMRFLAALRQSHRVSAAAVILPPDGPALTAEVLGGSLRVDRNARVRRQATLQVAFDLELAATERRWGQPGAFWGEPGRTWGAVAAFELNLDGLRHLPFGGYVQLYRGIVYPDGTVERPLLATLRVDNVSWARSEGAATLELSDRMAQVQDEPFLSPWSAGGLTPSQACQQLVYDVFGDAISYTILTDPAAETALVDAVYDQDRAQAVDELAASVGAAAYFTANGDFMLAPVTLAATERRWGQPGAFWGEPGRTWGSGAAFELDAGPTGTLVDVVENLDRAGVRNGVAVRGQAGADSPLIFALAVDDDPASPTRWGGPFGKVAMIVASTSVQTQEQADQAAATQLAQKLSLTRTVTVRGVPNPALVPDDTVEVCFPDGREELMLVTAVSLPLTPTEPMELLCTGEYRPAVLPTTRTRMPRVRVFGAAAAWRELSDARLVPA
jgi:hypothetical protein